jgi:hypothetical protein
MRRMLRRPAPATVIAVIALVVAMSGTAIGDSAISAAKRLVTGAGIKNGSLTGKDLKNGSVTGRDLKDGSVTGTDLKDGSVTSSDIRNGAFLTMSQGDGRYRGLSTPLTGADVADKSLTLSDLGGSRPDELTTTTSSPIAIAAGACKAQLTGNFGEGVVGDLVVGTLTDAAGNAVLPNTAAFVPSVVIKTTQGGAVPNLVVCNTGATTSTIPTGSVFHWRLIDA